MCIKSTSSASSGLLPILLVLLTLGGVPAQAYKASDFSWIPPFLAEDEKPSITIIFDNSGSMLGRAYTSSFNSTNEYYGYFDCKTYYTYSSSGYFTPDNSSGTWNGNFLNWATMHRVDVARKVMTGGAYNSTTGCYQLNAQDSADRVTAFSYNDSSAVKDLNGNTKYMTPLKASITGIDHTPSASTIKMTASKTTYTYTMSVKGSSSTGVIQTFKDKARMALFVYDTQDPYHNGGKCLSYMSDNATSIDSIVSSINTIFPSTWTPLAETLYTVLGYISQDGTYNASTGPRYRTTSYVTATTTDPYYFEDAAEVVACTKQNIILITDGESTMDQGIPTSLKNLVTRPRAESAYALESSGSSYLIDIAYKGHTNDLRADISGTQSFNFFAVYAFGKGSYLLSDAARFGGFTDADGDGLPNLQSEYDEDGDGVPDNYFEAESGQELQSAVTQAFQLATAKIASGTAAAVTSQTRSGEGAVYQALFFPPTTATAIAPAWSGQIHAFLLDDGGNLREDTNGNGKLDVYTDKIIVFQDDAICRYTDTDGDSDLATSEITATKEILSDITDIAFLWSTTPWLNAMTDAEVVAQRSYTSNATNRHIFTFVDKNQNMVADNGEVQDFELPTAPSTATLNSSDYFYNYLTLYPSKSGTPALDTTDSIYTLRASSPSSFATLQSSLAQRQVDFIRGADVGNATISGITDKVRTRTSGGVNWRLGDIIYSSPTVVGKPAENYHTIYNDTSYANYISTWKHRRQVIYAGANDGMLHAFNGGFYNSTKLSFDLTRDGEAMYPLGMELWAYVPFNLLPHLRWLMDPDYGSDLHVAYMDLKPRVFDARVFFDSDGVSAQDSAHPDGWGTILVAGMRLGGASIQTDINKLDGNAYNATADRTMTSSYALLDVTNPEAAPVLLGEIHLPYQGFTTCYPTVMPMSTPDATQADSNRWYLVFGSGPASSTGVADSLKLGAETSDQNGRLYVVDLKALVLNKTVSALNSTSIFQTFTAQSATTAATFATTETASFISGPIAVDFDIGSENASAEFRTDAVYYGTVAGSQTSGTGTLRRLHTGNAMPSGSTVTWTGNSTLISVAKPVAAEPAVAMDDDDNIWIYFGTGRFFNRNDIPQTATMSFYGVKEPRSGGTPTWGTLSTDALYNSTQISLVNATCGETYTSSCVQVVKTSGGSTSTMTWSQLLSAVAATSGWVRDMDSSTERVVGQAAVLSGSVIFTSYIPSEELCTIEGSSSLWGLYYLTGTPYFEPILTTAATTFAAKQSLGQGLAITPNLYTSPDGTRAFVQTSTGSIVGIDLATPLTEKSGSLYWIKRQND